MKFFNLALLALSSLLGLLTSCSGTNSNEFVIKGRVNQPRLEGQWVYLVPMDPDVKARVGVDSMQIKDMKFEFKGGESFLGRITIDIKVRYGTQDLLVVSELGHKVNVLIDSISSGGGSPQNDLLQAWKDELTRHNEELQTMIQTMKAIDQIGDTIRSKEIRDSIDVFNQNFRDRMVTLAEGLGEGPAYDLLIQLYGKHDAEN